MATTTNPFPYLRTIGFLMVSAAITLVVYLVILQFGLSQLHRTAEARLAQSNDRFLSQTARYQQLVNTLSRHPIIRNNLITETTEDISELLLFYALSSGAQSLSLVDETGTITATSHAADDAGSDLVGTKLDKFDYVNVALSGALGWSHGLEDGSEPRRLYFSKAIFSPTGPVVGAIIASVRVSYLELEWSFAQEPVAYFDQAGVAFVSNRPELAMLQNLSLKAPFDRPVEFSTDGLKPFFGYEVRDWFGFEVWRNIESDVLPNSVLVLTKYLPRVAFQASIFQDISPALNQARLSALLSAVSLLLIGLTIRLTQQRRKALSARLSQEAALNEQLEDRVERRTAQLRETQKQLIAAGRLTALGEMSAGVSHELNQPLAAMQNYAENGRKFLRKGDTERASENFSFLEEQVHRIDRIIRSLRAFARNEEQEIRPVDFVEALDVALSLAETRLRQDGITLSRHEPDAPVIVMAGKVRLQQVLVNIINNAIDAMENSDPKRLSFALRADTEKAVLDIADTGAGISDPEKVFEPFFSTKDVGKANGMGLGLSISHGIIGSFAGSLTCRNAPEGGAIFTIELPLAEGTE